MELLERFMQKVNKDTANGCWEWTGYKDKHGAGSFHVNGHTEHAYRLAYELFVGSIPKGIRVSHTCNNPSCVNPNHLFTKTLLNRYWAFTNKGQDDECWEWTGMRNKEGYGHIQIGNQSEKAHRFAYKLFIGDIPKDMCICHKCDNPSCVNPKHLFLGTKLDNAKDRDSKGRGVYFVGEHHNMAKLKANQVKKIRLSITGDRGELTKLAQEYKVSVSCISDIKYKRKWKDIEL